MANKGKHLIENDYTPVTYDPQYILMVNHLKKYFPIKGGLLSSAMTRPTTLPRPRRTRCRACAATISR